ncbi:MAG: RNA polymerase sigma factor [Acidobacteriia bacterium]|nr:RNA polymerase sigma factor [Terriglobia bacterium]
MTGGKLDNLALAVHRNADGAVERLVRNYQDRLYSYALRLLRDPFDAREVTQDAFMRACDALTKRYDEPMCRNLELGPWLFRITRNLAFTRCRRRRVRREVSVEDSVEAQASGSGPAAEGIRNLETGEKRRALQSALDRLDREARDLVVLRFMEELSYAEIAAIVGSGETSVRGKVFRALRKLRTTLTKSGGRNAL